MNRRFYLAVAFLIGLCAATAINTTAAPTAAPTPALPPFVELTCWYWGHQIDIRVDQIIAIDQRPYTNSKGENLNHADVHTTGGDFIYVKETRETVRRRMREALAAK